MRNAMLTVDVPQACSHTREKRRRTFLLKSLALTTTGRLDITRPAERGEVSARTLRAVGAFALTIREAS
jgi:hypothetical protein